jgi:hypothetical protein
MQPGCIQTRPVPKCHTAVAIIKTPALICAHGSQRFIIAT